MMAWMAFAAAVATLAGVAALAAERALALLRLPTRGAWAAALAASLVLPFALPRPAETTAGAPESSSVRPSSATAAAPQPSAGPMRGTGAGERATGIDPGPSLRARVEPTLPWAWGVATAVMAAGLGAAALRLARRRRSWVEETMVGERVLVSPSVGPAVVGFVRPRIVMPRWTLGWDEALQRLMLRHEREHVRAGDPLLLLGGVAAVALMPWSLALWWQLRRLRLSVEVDCDARTLRATGDVGAYGRLLLDVGRLGGAGARVPLVAFSESHSFLERRINAMTMRMPSNPVRRVLGWTTVAAVAAVSLAALPAPARVPLLPAAAPALQADTSRVWTLAQVDRLPALANAEAVARLIERVYPPLLRNAGIEGRVTVDLVVGEDGLPQSPSVATATRAEFREAALTAVNATRFRPATRQGRTVRVRLSLPIAFQLPERASER